VGGCAGPQDSTSCRGRGALCAQYTGEWGLPFFLEFESPSPSDATIYYTTDGTTPSAAASAAARKYEGEAVRLDPPPPSLVLSGHAASLTPY